MALYIVTDGNIRALMIPLEIEADVSDGATLSGFVAEMQLSGTFSDKIYGKF